MDKNKFFLGIMVAAVGLFMLISPEAFIKFVVIILGIALIFDGVFILVTVRNLIADVNYGRVMAVHGWLSIGVGAVAVLLPLVFAAVVWTIMAYSLAVYLLVAAGMEVYAITVLTRNGISTKKSIFEVIVCVFLAVVLFILPHSAGNALVRVFGVVLLAAGVLFSLVQWRLRPIVVQPDSVVSVEEDEIAADEQDD
ncbi:MAG: DUF308 domain-containing protein [Treponema sp.]|nr:DUF308 domain-containing protein [Treponema sp.]